MRLAVYPGSFDPVTSGHLDIVERSARLFDRVTVAILNNSRKEALFTVEQRRELLKEAVGGLSNVDVDVFDGLLVDYARRRSASAIVRGIRAVSDYEYELQMSLMNRGLAPEIETVFFPSAAQFSHVSSNLVKEVCRLGGSIAGLVPDFVEQRLKEKFR